MRILEIKFERNWNFGNYLRVWDLKKKLNYGNWDFRNKILKEIRIENCLRSRNYEN